MKLSKFIGMFFLLLAIGISCANEKEAAEETVAPVEGKYAVLSNFEAIAIAKEAIFVKCDNARENNRQIGPEVNRRWITDPTEESGDSLTWAVSMPANQDVTISSVFLAGESIATTSTQSRLTHFGPRLEKRKIEYFAVIDHSTSRVKELRWLESINANFGKSDAEVVWEIEKSGSCEL